MFTNSRRIVSVFFLLIAAGTALAQNAPAQPPAAEQPSAPNPQAKKRYFSMSPVTAPVSRKDATPLTAGQKFEAFGEATVRPFYIVATAAQAGVAQAADRYPSYGQGAEGYGKRFGAAFAGSTSNNFFSEFFFPVMLKEDPRYFRLGTGTTSHRLGYAIASEFVGYNDNGKRTFMFSNVLGAVASGGISNAYYPAADRGAALTMRNAGVAIGFGTASGILSEFWPDIKHKLFGKKK